MKKNFTLAIVALAGAALVSQAQQIPTGTNSVKTYGNAAKRVVKRAAASEFEAFYPAPAGVFYLGLPMDNDHYDVPEYGVAPCKTDITFSTEVDLSANDYEWTYISPSGKELETSNDDIVMNVTETSVVDAPYLYVQGYFGQGGYTMARGGILFGQGYYDDFYATNINIAKLNSEFFNVAGLAVNYAEAGKNFADEYPLKISDVNIKAWGELFRYGGAPYKFDALRMALIFTGAACEADQVEADIYKIDNIDNPVLGEKLATYTNTKIVKYDTYQGSYWYTIEFGPQENETAPVIKDDVMVVFRVADGVTTIISPTMAGIPELSEQEPTTSYVIADYTRAGNSVQSGCLPYVGEYQGRYLEYCKHWTASGKINYDVPTNGIDEIAGDCQNVQSDNSVYTLTGIKVSSDGDMSQLPRGIYISNGKKVLVK